MSAEKKLLFITARLPYPASSGRKNVMYNYCKILHEKLGYEINVISFLEDGDSVDSKPSFINNVVVIPNVGSKRKVLNLLKYTFLKRIYPMQVSLFFDSNYETIVNELIDKTNPSIVIADMVRTTEYLKNVNIYKIADLDDMLSIRYERQLDMDMATINPYGAYLYSLPGLIRKILSLKVLKKIILKNEVKLLRNYERNISQIYDKTVFVAEREANLLNKELNFNKAIAIPLGVDVEYFGEYFKKIESEANTISFLGAMSVAHNEAGAIHFMKDIFPLVQKEIPDAKFIVVGGGITELLKQSAKGNNRIVFTGRVDDVRTNIGKTRCFVCPLTFGSGIKTKNLEAMAMGVPVVTTSIGAENIYAKDGTDWLVADSNKKFADAIISILKDDKLHENLQLNAYNFVNENFTWSVAENKMRELFGK